MILFFFSIFVVFYVLFQRSRRFFQCAFSKAHGEDGHWDSQDKNGNQKQDKDKTIQRYRSPKTTDDGACVQIDKSEYQRQ